MKIIFIRNRKEEIFYILTEHSLNQPTLIITNTIPMFTGFSSLIKYRNTLFIQLEEKFTLKLLISQLQFYSQIFISNFQLNNFEIAFLKKFLKNCTKKVFLLIKTEQENKIFTFEESLKEFLKS